MDPRRRTDIADGISRILATREADRVSILAEHANGTHAASTSDAILGRIKNFFGLDR